MDLIELKKRLEALAPKTVVEVFDLTGTQDHYQAVIVSPIFAGKKIVDQHRLVMDLMRSEVDSGEIHALTLKTFTPEQYQQSRDRSPQG
jgi:stress-induced morphogen